MVEESVKGDYNNLNSSFQLNHDANSPFQKFQKHHFILLLHVTKQQQKQKQNEEKDVSKTMTHSFPQNFCKNNNRNCFVTFCFKNNFLSFLLIKKIIETFFVIFEDGSDENLEESAPTDQTQPPKRMTRSMTQDPGLGQDSSAPSLP